MSKDLIIRSSSAEFLIFERQTHNKGIQVRFEDGDLWLTQKAIGELFDIDRTVVTKHIKNIYSEFELDENSTSANFALVQQEGNREITRTVLYYNLDVVISVGYRTNSDRVIRFRIWATKILKEYMTKGFALNDERFIKAKYFDELLERIKTIRVSERMAYQKITDLFIATSTDYNPKSEDAYTFFKIVQNKLHYAISGHTAAELIYNRANSEKEHMGLTSWKNSPDGLIYKYDVTIAKNYLNKEEIEKLNDLTNMFLVFAEDEAKERHIMTMKDWINATDDLLKFRRKEVLQNSGNISHKQAVEKVESANSLETYLSFKISKHSLYKDGFTEDDIYPKRALQVKAYEFDTKGYIRLSHKQREVLQKENLDNFSAWLDIVNSATKKDEGTELEGHQKKLIKEKE